MLDELAVSVIVLAGVLLHHILPFHNHAIFLIDRTDLVPFRDYSLGKSVPLTLHRIMGPGKTFTPKEMPNRA